MYTQSFFGSLQNNSNQQYRYNKASHLQSTFTSPACLMNFQLQSDGNFGIFNVENNQYFQSTITTMADSITGTGQEWRLIPYGTSSTQFYVQNVQNSEYMTSSAGSLHNGTPGPDEIWNIVNITNLASI
jgi:hypothetical protein